MQRIEHEKDEGGKKQGSIQPREFVVETHQQKHQRSYHRTGHVLANCVGGNSHRRNHGRRTYDEEGVEDVTTDDITDSHVGSAFQGGNKTDEKLRG